MSMAYKIHRTYENSASSIYQECSSITSDMLGYKRSFALYFCVSLSSFINLSFAAVIISLIMMLYGSYVTTLQPASIASSLLIYALFLAAAGTISSVITRKCGRHFFLNCKVSKQLNNPPLDALLLT